MSKTLTMANGRLIIHAEAGKGLATFSGLAYSGAVMRPNGWFGNVIVDLDGLKVPSQHRPALVAHDHLKIAGHTTRVRVTRKGIEVEGVFSGQEEHVNSVVVPARNGFQFEMSIGANPIRTEYLESGQEATINGLNVLGPLSISRETDLGEVSFVALGADGNTHVSIAASGGRTIKCETGHYLEGIDPTRERWMRFRGHEEWRCPRTGRKYILS